jgi:hypothetical protein
MLGKSFTAIREARPFDIPRQAGARHQPDHAPSEIGLPPMEAMTGRIGEGVMVVVPPLSKAKSPKNRLFRLKSAVSYDRVPHRWPTAFPLNPPEADIAADIILRRLVPRAVMLPLSVARHASPSVDRVVDVA